MMASTTIVAILGFFFWLLIARLYNPSIVGAATTLISTMTLLSGISILGLNIALVRYLPKYTNRNKMINSTFFVSGIAAVLCALIFILGINIFSPKLSFINESIVYVLIFVGSVIVATFNLTVEAVFIAYRAAENILTKSIVLSVSKLLFPFLFISFMAFGIFTSVVAAMTLATFFAIATLILKYKFKPELTVNTESISHMAKFSLINYFAGFAYQAPQLLLPLLIFDFLTANAAAYYYIDAMILNFLIIIPNAVTQAFLAEGSYNNKALGNHFKKSLKFILAFLIPSITFFFFFGEFILNFFGSDYAIHAFTLLRFLSISALFTSIQLIGMSALRIKHKNIELLIINLAGGIVTLGLCLLFMNRGISGIGIGWLIGQVITGLIFLFLLKREIN
jgi:O-antigen/teichoic acid export membrane protein